jgi:hypothetical protein
MIDANDGEEGDRASDGLDSTVIGIVGALMACAR